MRVTVAREITEKATPKPIGESKVIYPYPVVKIRQIVLWINSEYASPYLWSNREPLVMSKEGR
jgi:hypothetical protein